MPKKKSPARRVRRKKSAGSTVRNRGRVKTSTKKAVQGRRSQPRGALSALAMHDLEHEIRRRHDVLETLEADRTRLIRQLKLLDKQIVELCGSVGRKRTVGGVGVPSRARLSAGRRRHNNEASLVEVLARQLDNKSLTVTEAAEAVQRAGYKTTSVNFRTIVNQALIANPERFKKVARGTYTVK